MDIPERQLKSNILRHRLGDNLLATGLLSRDQLEEAIEYQCIFGGKLGTSLIELGFVEEDQLAKVLSEQLKLHYINPELLMNVPDEILKLVPKTVARQYLVVPYHKEGRRLFLAMNDATNLAHIDELSFKLNHIIVPLAVPEFRLIFALNKHYNFPLSPRYENLGAQLKRRPRVKKNPSIAAKVSTHNSHEELILPLNIHEDWPLLGETDDHADVSLAEAAYFDIQTPRLEVTYTSLCQQLVAANERNDIAKAVTNYLGQDFCACGFFMIRNTAATGWYAISSGVERHEFSQLNLSLSEPSIFDSVIKNKNHFLGMVTDSPQNRKFLHFFNFSPPQASFFFPLLVRNRVVSILFVQDQMEILEKRLSELINLAQKIETAFTILILKKKLLTI